jgi:hypothetical protein
LIAGNRYKIAIDCGSTELLRKLQGAFEPLLDRQIEVLPLCFAILC